MPPGTGKDTSQGQVKRCWRCEKEKPKTEFHRGTSQCKPCKAAYRRQYYLQNKSREKALATAYQRKNPQYKRRWRQKNGRAWKAKRRATEKQATPSYHDPVMAEWQEFAIGEIYDLARLIQERTGRPIHVDHIVPLTHDKVCGLHCIENLQLLDARDNLSKGNSFEVE